ncbi:MAG: methyltransferase domain-containing protein [Gammaproteobacteria bacterium]|nr:methyltransferase domain-containing protein [Gammaproteobacteria bacterium]
MSYSNDQLDKHTQVLAEKVFLTDRLPHFNLLLREIKKLSQQAAPETTVVSLERGLLYGGLSLVGPYFHRQEFISIDCSPNSADNRGAYNKDKVVDENFLRVPITKRAPIENTGLAENTADLVLVPNLVHHIADQHTLFCEMARITKPHGKVFVFEPTLRELHQIPDDYLRYTPYGMYEIMRSVGLHPVDTHLDGGPFSAIGYCWLQALEYMPPDEREKTEEWFYTEHWPQLKEWEEKFKDNLVREHTKFPVGFSILAEKR